MPDGSNSPDAPITVYVDGDIQACPFIEDLKRAGLRLVQENGKTYLRRADKADKETAANIAFEIAIECSHLIASINLLLAGIEGEQIKVAEYDVRSGTVVNGLYGLEWGVDRIQRLAEKVK